MKLKLLPSLIFLSILFLNSCNKTETDEIEIQLNENEFKFVPASPGVQDEINIITYDCGYNEFSSLIRENNSIELKKRFNGQMKRPCILEYDTIPLGKLAKGAYQVTYLIIDINPFATDSVFSQKTETLIVD